LITTPTHILNDIIIIINGTEETPKVALRGIGSGPGPPPPSLSCFLS